MSARSWTVDIPAPTNWLNANKGGNRLAKAATVKLWRDAAHVLAKKARLPKLAVCRITATLSFPDKRRRDCPNYYPTIKAAIDGLVDADVLDDDSDFYVRSLTIQPGRAVSSRGVLSLTLHEVTA